MKKRIFSRILALVMAVSLLSTTAFAASFKELQGAIDSGESVYRDNYAEGSVGADRYKIEATKDDTGAVNIKLWDTVTRTEDNESISISGSNKNVSIDLNGNTINGNKQEGSVIVVDKGAQLTLDDTSTNGKGKITGGTGNTSNRASVNTCGGGICVLDVGTSFVMNGGNITGNEIPISKDGLVGFGGGVGIEWGASFTMNGGTITENKAGNGGGVYVDEYVIPEDESKSSTFILNGGVIADNQASGGGGILSGGILKIHGGAIKGNSATRNEFTPDDSDSRIGGGILLSYGSFTMDGGSVTNNTAGLLSGVGCINYVDYSVNISITGGCISNNTDTGDTGSAFQMLVDSGEIDVSAEKEIHSYGEWKDNGDGTRICTCEYCGKQKTEGTPIDHDEPTSGPTTETPATPELPAGGETITTIEDEETPLAGLVSIAQLLEELRQYEGVEDVELPEDFQWIDHEFAQAIYWGLQEELVADTEEKPLDPDELVSVAILRDVLENFVEYKGLTDFVVTVDGEDDMIVMDLGERLTVFYGELEAALEALAA